MPTPNLQASRKTKKTAVGEIPVDWAVRRVRDVGNVVTGSTPATRDEGNYGGSRLFATPGDLGSSKYVTRTKTTLSSNGFKQVRLIPKGSVLFTCIGSTIGKTGVAGEELATNQQINAVIPNEDIDGEYLYYALNHVADHVKRLAGTQAVPIVCKSLFESVEIPLPPFSEQCEIASVLCTCDRASERQESLLAAKHEFKRGLMQQLLTGQTRFKEFKGERWRNYRLGELLKEVDRYVTFDDEHTYKLASIRRRSEGLFFREALHGKDIKTKVMKTIRAGDFVLSKMQVVHGAWGLVADEFDGMFVSDSYISLVPLDPKKLKIEFLNYLSQTRRLRHLAYLACHGVHIEKMTFNLEDFFHEKITIPPTIEEQVKIAAVLNTSDQEIELLEKQLDALKEQKRGLMQMLLTGEVRVKTEIGKAESRKHLTPALSARVGEATTTLTRPVPTFSRFHGRGTTRTKADKAEVLGDKRKQHKKGENEIK